MVENFSVIADRLIGRLIDLVKARKERDHKRYSELILPVYEDARVVASDYLSMFTEVISQLEAGCTVKTAIEYLEKRRFVLLPLRIRLRSSIARDLWQDNENLSLFEKGVWGVLRGGYSLFEDGHTPMRDFGWGDHTLLDLLYAWSHEPFDVHRERYIQNAREQRAAVERAWKLASEGFATAQDAFLKI